METKVEKNIFETAKKVLFDETEAIKSLISTIDKDFANADFAILNFNENLKH